MIHTGRHFLQIPGPTNILTAFCVRWTGRFIDHRGPEFAELALELLAGLPHGLPDFGPGRDVPLIGYWSLGSCHRQCAFARRPRPRI